MDDRADDSIKNGEQFEALTVTDDWVQLAEERWLPRKFVRQQEVAPATDISMNLIQQGGAKDPEIELEQPFVGKGRPRMTRIIASVDQACTDQLIDSCAVLSCGPSALLVSVKDAIAQTKTEASFEYHEETFDF
jgi:hypothetical protein